MLIWLQCFCSWCLSKGCACHSDVMATICRYTKHAKGSPKQCVCMLCTTRCCNGHNVKNVVLDEVYSNWTRDAKWWWFYNNCMWTLTCWVLSVRFSVTMFACICLESWICLEPDRWLQLVVKKTFFHFFRPELPQLSSSLSICRHTAAKTEKSEDTPGHRLLHLHMYTGGSNF